MKPYVDSLTLSKPLSKPKSNSWASEAADMLRPCLGLDGRPCPNLTDRTRCPHHQQALNQRTWAGKSGRYNTQYRHQRAALLADSPLCHWCGLAPATTADHTPNGLVPACKPCNSARGGRGEA